MKSRIQRTALSLMIEYGYRRQHYQHKKAPRNDCLGAFS